MDANKVDLFYGSLLHDIGKIVQRATQQKIRHSELGADFLKGFKPNESVLNQVKYHHYHELKHTRLETDDLAYITYIADNIASGVDRREHGEAVERQWDSKINLEDIFNKFGEKSSARYFEPRELDPAADNIFAQVDRQAFTAGQYSGILRRFEETLSVLTFDETYMQSLLNLVEATASFIPSSTNMKEVVDISLYNHMKLTAGLAAAIHDYLNAATRKNYREELFTNTSRFYEEKAFLLASFDISGIQDFIYTITSSGAHKQLRSRSFYLEMIGEWMIDCLLEKCELTRANLMYVGGGHAYLLLPNTDFVKQQLTDTEQAFNDFFLRHFATKLYVAFGHHPFSAKEVMSGNTPEEYRAIFQNVSREISDKKITRYSPDIVLELNKGGKRSGRECVVCHQVDHLLDDENECQLCSKLANFSRNIQRDSFFEVNQDASGLPVGPDAYLHHITRESIKNNQISGKVYSKNQFHTGVNQATQLWVGDYSGVENNLYSLYAERDWGTTEGNPTAAGIKRLGVLRCDVDDLGYAFMAGFSHQDNGRYNTFARTATFSRSMSIFFKLYINTFAKDKRLTIIYAGGDDVFLLGAWDEVLDFAVTFRQHFLNWTNGKLTLSSGFGLFHDKTPINTMAQMTGKLEEAAKNNGKDSICLFSEGNTFKYDTFIDDIYGDKLPIIRNFFNTQNERGKAFIYKILDLIHERDEKDRISFARLAYYLARLEDSSADKQQFAAFKASMKEWFDDGEQIRRAEMALTLYVYETRKDG